MALQPKSTKYKKRMKGRTKGVATRGTLVEFGSYGLKTLDACWITARQIEAARKTIIRHFKKGGKLWMRIFPDKPVTSKGTEFQMGGGKGEVSHYVAPVKPGRVMFEVGGVEEEVARQVFRKAATKLPVKTKFVIKKGLNANK